MRLLVGTVGLEAFMLWGAWRWHLSVTSVLDYAGWAILPTEDLPVLLPVLPC
jgi:hypothetical protein